MKKIIILSLVFVFIIFIGLIYWSAFLRKAGRDISVSIKSGESTPQIARNLQKERVINSPVLFSLYIYQRHWYLQEGVYKITSNMSMIEIIEMIKEGKAQEYLVTIPEGWRLTQIDELLSNRKIIKQGELIRVASTDEGYLFPDTYRFPLGISANEVKDAMTSNFNKQASELKPSREALIIASIIEREAKFDEDRAKIAGVYWNRVEKGMRLEADPTIQYAKGSWDPISRANYKDVISPYNTYLNDGLPPGPICNPGLKSIEAAVHPEKNGWVYFFHKSDGHAVYSETLVEHENSLSKYR